MTARCILPDLPPFLAKAASITSRLRNHLALLRCWPMTLPTSVPNTTACQGAVRSTRDAYYFFKTAFTRLSLGSRNILS